ncbi:hypothetical protein [Psychromonas sp. SA13A]|uniref:hypothetical protein n=1 Tax=Psychromonas sp. SA13A TaxID=2686346 RepID=UPI001408A2B7|nr:hypothetical protein [Psychromonas sp. SA13A]
MNFNKKKSLLMLTLAATLGLAACSENNEKTAGEHLDETTAEAKSMAEKTGDNISSIVSDGKDAASDAGDAIEEAATDTGNAIEDTCEDVKNELGTKNTDC